MCRSAHASSVGRPASIETRWRTVIGGPSSLGKVQPASCGRYVETGSSRRSRPSTTRVISAAPVKLFVIDAMRKTVFASGAESSPSRTTPTPPDAVSSPRRTTPQATPGARVRLAHRENTPPIASSVVAIGCVAYGPRDRPGSGTPSGMEFDGHIIGASFASGDRIVAGRWLRSPFGAFADVMWCRPDGWRVLLAPSEPVRDFLTRHYAFDESRIESARVERCDDGTIEIAAGPLRVSLQSRGALARVLAARARPRRLRTSTRWIDLEDRLLRPLARTVFGARTCGPWASPPRERASGTRSTAIGAHGRWRRSTASTWGPRPPALPRDSGSARRPRSPPSSG